ncbi:invasin domain 3-containing protein (plasmid) [Arsenophonus nasoniae]|uniref:Invasin domain 3-containing protein n=2 Tax=Arsenophonus nasoniae TaxID=638 RepID=A0AA95GQ91_9GAMM|nr:invasin domain 3-containing protein [Arsenophonus nasoniae]
MIYKKQKIIALFLLFFHFFSILFLSFISTVKAIENAEVAETMAGIQALLEQDRKDSYSAIQRTPEYSRSSSKNSQENNNIKKSLPDLGNNPALLEKNNETILAGSVSQVGNILSNDNSMDAAINYAKSIGEGLVNQRITDFFRQYGTSRISISTDKKISGDFLLPVIDNTNSLLFTQLGLRTNKDRNTLNLGLGYRQYWGDWMYGINTFYDYDYSGGNARLGLGGEAWTDYLKLSANGYFGLTDWHQSKIAVMDDYDERPATGFDVRAEAYLPTYPKLGGSIKYEKYFGKGVHLGTGVDPNKLKDDPYALTLGINYTPIPLITLKGEHAAGDRNDTMVGLDIIYRFGVPLLQQLDADAVDVMRSLVGNKYDFVDRNYDIVMQYRKQELINISLPVEMRAEAKETIIIPATVNKTKYGLKKINWTVSPSFIANGGSYQVISPTQLEIILPAYVYKTQKNTAQEYQISAVGIDNNDNESNRATTTIRVKPSRNVVNDLIVEPNSVLPANNRDHFTTTAVITNEHGQPLSHQVITFHVDGLKQQDGKLGATLSNGSQSATNGDGITATTDSQGKAVIYITSKVAGEGKITATMENGNYKNGQLKFSADRNSAQIAKLNFTKDKALADGKEKNMLYALVTDQNGNAVENIAVNLTATNGAIIENGATANTNQRGELIFGVTSTKAGSSEVTVEINGSQKTLSVVFVTGHPSAEKSLLTVQPATIVANGKTVANLKLELKDAQGNPISGGKVDFTTSLANSRTSDTKDMGNGVYTAELTGITAGETTVGVKINGSVLKNKTAKVVLTADSDNPSPTKSKLEANPTRIVADGSAFSTVKLILQDVNGNAISGLKDKVKFSTPLKNSKIGDTVEENNGVYTAKLSGTTAGETTLGVEVNGQLLIVSRVLKVNLSADGSKPSADKSILAANPSSIVADGKISSTITLELKDVNGNPLAEQGVEFIPSLPGSEIGKVTEKDNGIYEASLVGTKAGQTTISVGVNGKALVGKTATVTLTADNSKPSKDKSKLEADPIEIVADGQASSTIKLTLLDVNDNPLAGQKVKFNSSLKNSHASDQVKDEGNGIYTATLTGTTAGETSIEVIVNGAVLQIKNSAKITFTADKKHPSKDKSILAANPSSIVADGKETSTLKLTLMDVHDNPIEDEKVKFISSLPNSDFDEVQNKGKGVYTAKFKGKTAGVSKIKVRVNDQELAIKTEVTLTADSKTAVLKKVRLEGDSNSKVADGVNTFTFIAVVKDANDNPVMGQDVRWKKNKEKNVFLPEISEPTDVKGETKIILTSAKKAVADILVIANKDGIELNAEKVSFTADSKNAKIKLTWKKKDEWVLANNKDKNIVDVLVYDVNENPVPNAEISIHVPSGLTSSSERVETNKEGFSSLNITSNAYGLHQVEGKVTSSNSTDSVKVIFIPETFDLTIKVSNK